MPDTNTRLSAEERAEILPYLDDNLSPSERKLMHALMRIEGPEWSDLHHLAQQLGVQYTTVIATRAVVVKRLCSAMPKELGETVRRHSGYQRAPRQRPECAPTAPAREEIPVLVYAVPKEENDVEGWLDCLTTIDRDLLCMLLGMDGWDRTCVNGAARLLHTRPIQVAKRVLDVLDALDTAGMPPAVRFDIWGQLHAPFEETDEDGRGPIMPAVDHRVLPVPMSSVDRQALHAAVDRIGELQLEVASLREAVVKAFCG